MADSTSLDVTIGQSSRPTLRAAHALSPVAQGGTAYSGTTASGSQPSSTSLGKAGSMAATHGTVGSTHTAHSHELPSYPIHAVSVSDDDSEVGASHLTAQSPSGNSRGLLGSGPPSHFMASALPPMASVFQHQSGHHYHSDPNQLNNNYATTPDQQHNDGDMLVGVIGSNLAVNNNALSHSSQFLESHSFHSHANAMQGQQPPQSRSGSIMSAAPHMPSQNYASGEGSGAEIYTSPSMTRFHANPQMSSLPEQQSYSFSVNSRTNNNNMAVGGGKLPVPYTMPSYQSAVGSNVVFSSPNPAAVASANESATFSSVHRPSNTNSGNHAHQGALSFSGGATNMTGSGEIFLHQQHPIITSGTPNVGGGLGGFTSGSRSGSMNMVTSRSLTGSLEGNAASISFGNLAKKAPPKQLKPNNNYSSPPVWTQPQVHQGGASPMGAGANVQYVMTSAGMVAVPSPHHTATTNSHVNTTPSSVLLSTLNNNNTSSVVSPPIYFNSSNLINNTTTTTATSDPLVFMSPTNAVTNSSCVSGDVPMSGGVALPLYETGGRPLDAFEIAMLREQYLHGAFHMPIDPADSTGKKKRRRRKRSKKNAEGSDDQQSDVDDDAVATGDGPVRGDCDGEDKTAKKDQGVAAANEGESVPVQSKSKSRVLLVPGLPVHLPLVGKVGYIPYATVLRQYLSLLKKKTALATLAANKSLPPRPPVGVYASDIAKGVDEAIATAEAAASPPPTPQRGTIVAPITANLPGEPQQATTDVTREESTEDALPSYTDVTSQTQGDTKSAIAASIETIEAALSTTQARLFVGQVPYNIDLELMKAIFFVIGGGCEVEHVERIVKWKNRELPSGCLHVHMNVEYKASDFPPGSDPTEASPAVNHALKLDQVALLDDEGIWVPTSNRRAFSIIDSHVDAFEQFLLEQAQKEADQAAGDATTASGDFVSEEGSQRPKPSTAASPHSDSATVSHDGMTSLSGCLSQATPGCPPTIPGSLGSFGLTFKEFKTFLRGCAMEVSDKAPEFVVAWNQAASDASALTDDGELYFPSVPVVHPDIVAINLHGRSAGTTQSKPAAEDVHAPTINANGSFSTSLVVGGSRVSPAPSASPSATTAPPLNNNALPKAVLCQPVPSLSTNRIPHTRPLNLRVCSSNSQSSSDATPDLSLDGGAAKNPHHRAAESRVKFNRPPSGPENPDFVVPSLADQREALVAYVSHLKDPSNALKRPIDRPYQLMSVQRARSSFPTKEKGGNGAGEHHNNGSPSGDSNPHRQQQQRSLLNQFNPLKVMTQMGWMPNALSQPHQGGMHTTTHPMFGGGSGATAIVNQFYQPQQQQQHYRGDGSSPFHPMASQKRGQHQQPISFPPQMLPSMNFGAGAIHNFGGAQQQQQHQLPQYPQQHMQMQPQQEQPRGSGTQYHSMAAAARNNNNNAYNQGVPDNSFVGNNSAANMMFFAQQQQNQHLHQEQGGGRQFANQGGVLLQHTNSSSTHQLQQPFYSSPQYPMDTSANQSGMSYANNSVQAYGNGNSVMPGSLFLQNNNNSVPLPPNQANQQMFPYQQQMYLPSMYNH